MSFAQLDDITGKLSTKFSKNLSIPLTFKYGSKFDIKMTIESNGEMRGKRKGAYFSNVTTLLGKATGKLVDDMHIYDGIHSEMVGGDGQLNPDLIAKVMANLWEANKKLNTNRVQALVHNDYDNCTSVLYNMLRMYYIKLAIETKKGNHTIKVNDKYYNDGHVAITNGQMNLMARDFNLQDFNITDVVPETGCHVTEDDNYDSDIPKITSDEYNYTVSCDKLKAIDIAIIRIAASQWREQECPLTICHPSPKLVKQIDVFNYRPNYQSIDDPEFAHFTSMQIMQAICNYVESHRLHATFDMAYMMLCQGMYTHKPRSAEALVWAMKPGVVNMPKAYSCRGILSILMAGTPYVINTNRWATFVNWKKKSSKAIIHSAALSEAVHCSSFDYITRRRWSPNDGDDFEEADPLNLQVGEYSLTQCGVLKELKLASMRFGREFKASWVSRAGLVRYDWFEAQEFNINDVDIELLDVHAFNNYTIRPIDLEQENLPLENRRYKLKFDAVPPCCYPLLSMEIGNNEFYMDGKTVEATLDYDTDWQQYTTDDHKVAHRFMNIMRIAGYDTTIKRYSDNKLFSNWAANADGHYMPTFLKNYKKQEKYLMDAKTLRQRRRFWIELPNAGQQIRAKMELKYLTYQFFYDDELCMATFEDAILYQPTYTNYKIAEAQGHANYMQFALAMHDPIKDYEDFRLLHKGTPPVFLGRLGPVVDNMRAPLIEDNLDDQD
nr:putative capsid protein [Poaceae Liege totivirus 8]